MCYISYYFKRQIMLTTIQILLNSRICYAAHLTIFSVWSDRVIERLDENDISLFDVVEQGDYCPDDTSRV